jgi:hypothetical protein
MSGIIILSIFIVVAIVSIVATAIVTLSDGYRRIPNRAL